MEGPAFRQLRKHAKGTRDSATYTSLTIGPVPPGQEWYVKYIAMHDLTTAAAVIVPFVKTRGDSFPLPSYSQTAATYPYAERVEILLTDHDEIEFRFYTGALNDVIEAWAYGTYREVGEGFGLTLGCSDIPGE